MELISDLQRKAFQYKELDDPLFTEKGIRLFMHLQGENHDPLLGNKGYKLKYNIREAEKAGKKQLLSFGGAFSNHIYALANAGARLGFETIGVIRGEREYERNPSLSKVKEWGMKLHFVERSLYRDRNLPEFQSFWSKEYPGSYLIPEGAANSLGVKGCAEIPLQWEYQLGWQPDFWAVAAGTGSTACGMIKGLSGNSHVLVFPALKGIDLESDILRYLNSETNRKPQFSVNPSYHFGGFAKMPAELARFIKVFEEKHAIRTDPIYTSKMMYGLYDLIRRDHFVPGTRIVAYHSGGLQGWSGMIDRFNRVL